MTLPARDFAPAGARIIFELLTKAGVPVPQEAVDTAVEGVTELFEGASISPYVGFAANSLLTREMASYEKGEDVPERDEEDYPTLYFWANVWIEAELAALRVACRNLPKAMYKFRFTMDWGTRNVPWQDETWQWHESGRDQEVVRWWGPAK